MNKYCQKLISINISAALFLLSACNATTTPNAPASIGADAITATIATPPTVPPTAAPTALPAIATSPKPTATSVSQATPTSNAQKPNGFIEYRHTAGVFDITLPNDWQSLEENHYDQGYVHFIAVGADADMSFEVTDTERAFSAAELEDMMRKIVTNEFGKLPGFAIEDQGIFTKTNGATASISFNFKDPKKNNAQYRAIRIYKYSEKKISALGVYVLADKFDKYKPIFSVIEKSVVIDYALRLRNVNMKAVEAKSAANVIPYRNKVGAFEIMIPDTWKIQEENDAQTGSAKTLISHPGKKAQLLIWTFLMTSRPTSRLELEAVLKDTAQSMFDGKSKFKLLNVIPEDPKRPNFAQVTYTVDVDLNGKVSPFWGVASLELSKGKDIFYSVVMLESEKDQLIPSIQKIASSLVF